MTEDDVRMKNLRSFTSETAKTAGKKGGQASGKTRRRKKQVREIARTLLYAQAVPEYAQYAESLGVEGDADYLTVGLARVLERAMAEGDLKSLSGLIELAGLNELPKDEKTAVKIVDDV